LHLKNKNKTPIGISHFHYGRVLTFDGHLDYSDYLRDPQVFLNWFQCMDMYFNRCSFSEIEKVRFTITKLIGQASQYMTDLKRDRKTRTQRLIETLEYMKDKLITKYVSPYFYEFRHSPSIQPHRSMHFIPTSQIHALGPNMESQPTLDTWLKLITYAKS